MSADDSKEIYRTKVNLETAQIAWKELQRFFASGAALAVASDLDLVEVAFQISQDNAMQVQQWIASGKLVRVSDEQARGWLDANEIMWAVVVSPWVLVQPVRPLQ